MNTQKGLYNVNKGILWLYVPFLLFVLSIFAFAMSGLYLSESANLHDETLEQLLIFGLIVMLVLFISIPIGIYKCLKYLKYSNIDQSSDFDERSGRGEHSEIPDEIKGWNWGAAGTNIVWGLSNNVYIALLYMLPYVGFIMIFVLGAKGNEWAWKQNQWESPQKFLEVQNMWKNWGIAFFILMLLFSLPGIVFTIMGETSNFF
jgi:hypothetical protein